MDEDDGLGRDAPSTQGTPRWVKVFGIIAVAVVVLFLVLVLTGRGGDHGPGRHIDGDDSSGGHTGPPPGITHTQP